MHFWIRDFKNSRTGGHFRVYSDATNLPTLRKQIAERLKDAEWMDDTMYKHDSGLDMKREGSHPLEVEAIG